MTPLQAIRKECGYCKGGTRVPCNDEGCNLTNSKLTSLKKIKAHCKQCVPEQSMQGVGECDGKILCPEPHACSLHPFRLGHNPNRKGIGRTGGNPHLKKHANSGAL